ncbi:MAG: hypothetical protein ACJA08_002763 [Cyclobacteriaceae bacterium]|jgi:hypothetical protein
MAQNQWENGYPSKSPAIFTITSMSNKEKTNKEKSIKKAPEKTLKEKRAAKEAKRKEKGRD